MSVGDTVQNNVTGTYVVTRTPVGTKDASGRYTPGTPANINVDAGIFPVTPGRELQPLPEGHHASELRQVFTLTELFTLTPAQEPDQITYSGELWEVLSVANWGDFFHAYIARKATP